MPIFKKVNKDFFKKWSNEMAYVSGFFAADGYITVNKRGGQFWCIQITDKEFLESIKKVIGSEHKISKRPEAAGNKNLYRLQIGSIEMCEDLRNLGFRERKTKNMSVPNIPDKYFPDFVRGYFDGDGNVWSGKVHKERKKHTLALFVAFTSCSLNFLTLFHLRLKSIGVKGGSIYHPKNKDFYRLQLSTLDSLKLLEIMYNKNTCLDNGLFLKRKKKVFDRYR